MSALTGNTRDGAGRQQSSGPTRLSLGGLALLVVSAAMLVAGSRQSSPEHAYTAMDVRSAIVARSVQGMLNHFRATLVMAGKGLDAARCAALADEIAPRLDPLRPALSRLYCLDRQGLPVRHGDSPWAGLGLYAPGSNGRHPQLSPELIASLPGRLLTGQRVMLDTPRFSLLGKGVVPLAYPVATPDVAWLVGDIDLRLFERLAADVDPGPDTTMVVSLASGEFLARIPRVISNRLGSNHAADSVESSALLRQLSASERKVPGFSRSLPDYGVVVSVRSGALTPTGWQRWLEPVGALGGVLAVIMILLATAQWRRQQDSYESAFARLAANNERLDEVHRVNELGLWEYHLGNRTITWSGDALRLLGLDQAPDPQRQFSALARLHPDDRGRAARELVRCAMLEQPIDEMIRIAVPEQPVRHLHVRARSRVAPNGSRVVTGTLLDVTETQIAREQRMRVEAQYRYLFERSPIPLFVLDMPSKRILAANEAMADLYGWSSGELRSMHAVDLFAPDEHIHGEALLDEPGVQDGTIWPHQRRSGDLIYVRGYTSLVDFDGDQAHLVACVDFTEKVLAQEELIESEARFRLMSRVSNDAIYDYDIAHHNLWWSDSYRHHFGADPERLDGDLQTWVERVHPDDRRKVTEQREQALATRADHWDISYRYRRQDGGYAQVRDRGFVLRDGDGAPHRMIGGMLDRSAELEAQQALIEQETTYRGLVERLPLPLLVMRNNIVVYGNSSASEALRLRSGQTLVGRPIQDLFDPALCALLDDHSWFGITRQVRTKRLDGTDFLAEMAVSSYRDHHGEGIQAVLRDLTEQLRFEQILTHQARHDALTGLPNRRALEDRLRAWLAVASEHGGELAVVFLDLDQFKVINDALGHGVGDTVIRTVARRLHDAMGPDTTFGRFGGDEFMILTEADAAEALIKRVRDAMAESIEVMGTSQYMTASIGVAIGPRDGRDADSLIRSADAAMYEAKRLGRNRSVMYSSILHRAAQNRLETVSRLRESNLDRELALYYQTKHDAVSGDITGMELLLRWPHGPPTLRQPGRFIPICEETGLMVPVGRWALREACRLQAVAAEVVGRPCPLAVNVSAQQFMHDDLLAEIAQCLEETGADGHLLEVEITESVILVDPDRVVRTIEGLRKMGVEVAIDDFGNGYSNLGYLKHLPVTKLKIDQSFVRDLMIDRQNEAICRSIISLAHSLSLKVVAEGVETRRQRDWLIAHGCDELQGFLFSQPRPFASGNGQPLASGRQA